MNPSWFAREVLQHLTAISAALKALGLQGAAQLAAQPPQQMDAQRLEALQRLHMGSPMTTEEVRIALRISPSALDRLVRAGTDAGHPPPTFLLTARHRRWRGDAVIAWVERVNGPLQVAQDPG